MKIKFFRLANGLRIILIPREDFESLTFFLYFKYGSFYEEKKESGLAHFLEHLIFAGSQNFPERKKVLDELEKISAIFNGGTSFDFSYFYIKVLEKYKEQALFILADLIKNPLFRKEDIEKEKKIILEEIRLSEDDYLGKCLENLLETLFPNKNWGRRIIGFPETITAFNQKNILQAYTNYYTAKNSILVVIGKINNFKKLLELIDRNFKGLKRGKEKNLGEFNLKPSFNLKISQNQVNQTYFALGTFEKIKNFEEYLKERGFLYLIIMNRILGEGNNSRLFLKIREELNLAYIIKSDLIIFPKHLIFYIQTGLKKENYLEGIKAILEELIRIKKEGFTKEEIKTAYESILDNFLLDWENAFRVSRIYAYSYLYYFKDFKPRDLKKFVLKILGKKLAYDEINKKIKNFLQRPFSFSLIIPQGENKNKIEKFIKKSIKIMTKE